MNWFAGHQRRLPWRETRDPYSIWLSEVMLQQTQVETVIPYYNRFIEHYPNPGSLASACVEDVLKLWEGLGYYQRCHHFIRAVKEIHTRYGGRIPDDPELFRRFAGVGDYTAAAVMSIAYGHPLPVIDANVIRVMTRYLRISGETGKAETKRMILDWLKNRIPDDAPGDFNQAMMELGALICTPKNPRCGECPVAGNCGAYRARETDIYPFPVKKSKIPEYQVGLGLVMKDGKFLIQRRPLSGHLAGMWELPGGKALNGETPKQALKRKCRDETGMEILVHGRCASADHAYTHFKIHVSLYRCDAGDVIEQALRRQPLAWISPREIQRYPFGSVNHKLFLQLFHPLDTDMPHAITR
jgi:A/G-specific adenine glycosylase